MNMLKFRAPFALSNRQRHQILMFIILLLFGIIVTNHIQSVRASDKKSSLVIRYQERQEQLKQYEAQYQALLAENDRLNTLKATANDSYLSRKGNEALLAELQRVRILAGFTEVRGPGIIVTLNDKPDYDFVNGDSSDSLVHDGDIRHVLDLLRDNGAAAFSVNGLRITNSSFILCIGSTIRCNEQRMLPPFVITALGDPAVLAEAVATDQRFILRQMPDIGLIVNVQTADEVIIPAFAEADDFHQYISLLEGVKK